MANQESDVVLHRNNPFPTLSRSIEEWKQIDTSGNLREILSAGFNHSNRFPHQPRQQPNTRLQILPSPRPSTPPNHTQDTAVEKLKLSQLKSDHPPAASGSTTHQPATDLLTTHPASTSTAQQSKPQEIEQKQAWDTDNDLALHSDKVVAKTLMAMIQSAENKEDTDSDEPTNA